MGNFKGRQIRFKERIGQDILDVLSDSFDIRAAAKITKCAARTIYWWCECSKREREAFEAGTLQRTPKFKIVWPRESDDAALGVWFDQGVTMCAKTFSLTAHFQNVNKAVFGTERHVRDPRTNRVLYHFDEEAIKQCGNPDDPASHEAAMWLGIKDFPFAHDADGKRIPVTERIPVPAQLKLGTLRAINPLYDAPEKIEHRHEITGQVVVVDDRPKPVKSPKPNTALLEDLRARLTELRSNGPANPKPDRPVQVHGRDGGNDPPERTTTTDGRPAPTMADHPRAYTVKAPAPKPTPAQPPANRLGVDRAGYGRGDDLTKKGGYRVA